MQYSYFELENATNKFSDSNLIGLGGSSRVYSGYLKDGKTVAVKRIKAQGGPDAEIIFLKEVLPQTAKIRDFLLLAVLKVLDKSDKYIAQNFCISSFLYTIYLSPD